VELVTALQPVAQSIPRSEVGILGSFEVYRDGVRLPTDRWQNRISRLFKLLVTAPDHRMSRDDLIEILWPATAPQAGASNLRLLVHLLRQALAREESAPEGRESRCSAIVTHGGWVALNPDWTWEVDLDRFEQLALSEELQDRENAAALWRGQPLPEDRYDDWSLPIRQRIERVYRDLCLGLARNGRHLGSPQRAVQWLERILDHDPLDEEALQELLSLLADMGRRTEALQRYRHFERRLDEELDLRPTQETFAVVTGLHAPDGYAEDAGFTSSLQLERVDLGNHIVPLIPSYPFPSSPSLVGRGAQLGLLLHALATRRTGDSSRHGGRRGPLLLLVEAEAGLGKSRLLGEVARSAREEGMLTLAGGCYEQEGSIPYGPMHDALLDYLRRQPRPLLDAQLADRLPALARVIPEAEAQGTGAAPLSSAEGEGERLRLFSAIASVLEGISRDIPLVLLLDDLHWADDASLQLLHFLHRQPTLSRACIVGAYRAEEVVEGSLLAQLAIEVRAMESGHVLSLPPLQEADLTVLLEDQLGGRCSERLARAVSSRSAGNPFFAVQIVRLLQQEGRIGSEQGVWDVQADAPFDLPETVREVVARRLRRLDRVEREALMLAAVLGREVHYPALESMWRGTEDDLFLALDGAVGSRVLSATESGYVFRHPVLWEVVYQRIPTHRRPSLHRRAALALEAVYGDHADDHAAELAWHALATGDRERTLHYSLRAGDCARAAFAHEEAEGHYRAALPFARGVEEAEILEKLGAVLRATGRYDEAVSVLEQAAVTHQGTNHLERLGHVAAEIARVHALRATPDQGIARLRGMLELFTGHAPSPALAQLYLSLTELSYLVGDYREQLAAAKQARAMARELGEDRLAAHAEVAQGDALGNLGKLHSARRVLEGAIPRLEIAGDIDTCAFALSVAAWLSLDLGEFERSRSSVERALALAEQCGMRAEIEMAELTLGRTLLFLGHWTQARDIFERAVTMHDAADWSWGAAHRLFCLGEVDLLEGKLEAASRHLEECVEAARARGHLEIVPRAHRAMAERDLLRGDARSAVRRLEPFGSEEGMRGTDALVVLAAAYLEQGDEVQAEDTVTKAMRRASKEHNLLGQLEALRVRAALDARRGLRENAASALEAALSSARGMPYPYGEALVLYDAGKVYASVGRLEQARDRLDEALAIFQGLGAQPYIARTQQALVRLAAPGMEADVRARQ
jgi:DNA-binding SARP family transcriptional activator